MSFFGLHPEGHNRKAPGFSQAIDPFASFARGADHDKAIDFEDTYDGLGDQLDETDDAFNYETFGDDGKYAPIVRPVGTDFDFFNATAQVANVIEEESVRYHRKISTTAKKLSTTTALLDAVADKDVDDYLATPADTSSHGISQISQRPFRTGYEKYKDSEPIPDLSVDRSLWGMEQKSTSVLITPNPPTSGGRKIMSLEEVEAQLHADAKKAAPPGLHSAPSAVGSAAEMTVAYPVSNFSHAQLDPRESVHRPDHVHPFPGHGGPIIILERPQSRSHRSSRSGPPVQIPVHVGPQLDLGIHREAQPQYTIVPTHILKNPNRFAGDLAHLGAMSQANHPNPTGPPVPVSYSPMAGSPALAGLSAPAGHSTPSLTIRSPLLHGQAQTPFQPYNYHQQQQLLHRRPHHQQSQSQHMTEEEKATFMEQEMKRAKRNHKIFQLSKDNGFMTPQDKNFVTRIQLQQLVSATGNPIEHGTDTALSEDFYYQVFSQIRSSQRQNPSQPLNNFAQTYLFQTGNRHGGRRLGRHAENHVQRLEQQVQRAVEAAKNKPKNPQLMIAGSLGKISFSNAKTPKPMLDIKRADSSAEVIRTSGANRRTDHAPDQKVILRNIETVYDTLMMMEDHGRSAPPVWFDEEEEQEEWETRRQEWYTIPEQLNARLWTQLKVHEPIGATEVHPFIAFLSFAKGKKAMPRVFRHMSFEQRTTILTMIIYHLDQLDVTRGLQFGAGAGGVGLNAALRERVDLFYQTVMPSLLSYFNETGLEIVDDVLLLINSRLNVDLIVKTRIGASMLTMILSRAELLKQGAASDPRLWSKWEETFNYFFNVIEPSLPQSFPGSVNAGEDVYVWQLLAAIGVSASPEQQQRLVIAVKDRVLNTVAHARSLPSALAAQRLAHVNLFMRSIGLDVDWLQ